MRAIRCHQYGPPDLLTLDTLDDLEPQPGQVVIDVKAASVNFSDVLMIENRYPIKPPLPFTPGAEVAGIVRAVGANAGTVGTNVGADASASTGTDMDASTGTNANTTWQPGARVIACVGHGGFAEQVAVDASACVALPERADFATAAAFTIAYGTSHHALADRAALAPGETLLVLGAAGGVGLAAVQIGKALGARVIAAASSAAKLDACVQHGADATIHYSADYSVNCGANRSANHDAEDLCARIHALTDGKGPDVIYDPVGGIYTEPAFRSIAWRGRYLVVGFANGEIPRLPLNLTLRKGASLVGVFWGDFARREPQHNAAAFARMARWIEEGKLKPPIPARYALADTPRALQDMAARRVTGKIVIEP